MISRRKFLAAAVTAAVAPNVAKAAPLGRTAADPFGQRGYITGSFSTRSVVTNRGWIAILEDGKNEP
jgi:hypothetical protein